MRLGCRWEARVEPGASLELFRHSELGSLPDAEELLCFVAGGKRHYTVLDFNVLTGDKG
jgi:hypothetical protein